MPPKGYGAQGNMKYDKLYVSRDYKRYFWDPFEGARDVPLVLKGTLKEILGTMVSIIREQGRK